MYHPDCGQIGEPFDPVAGRDHHPLLLPAPKPGCMVSTRAIGEPIDLFEFGQFGIFYFFLAGNRFVDGGRETVQLTPYFEA